MRSSAEKKNDFLKGHSVWKFSKFQQLWGGLSDSLLEGLIFKQAFTYLFTLFSWPARAFSSLLSLFYSATVVEAPVVNMAFNCIINYRVVSSRSSKKHAMFNRSPQDLGFAPTSFALKGILFSSELLTQCGKFVMANGKLLVLLRHLLSMEHFFQSNMLAISCNNGGPLKTEKARFFACLAAQIDREQWKESLFVKTLRGSTN